MPEYFWTIMLVVSTVGSIFSIALSFTTFLTAMVDNKPYVIKSFPLCVLALAFAALWGYSFAQL